jgi:hypothetical protein
VRAIRSGQIRSINQHQLVLFYPHTNFTVRAADRVESDQVRSDQSINISSFYSTHILIPRCERLIEPTHILISRCERLIESGKVRSDQSINISSFYPTHILIPRCERLVGSGQVRSGQINQSTSARFTHINECVISELDILNKCNY